MPDSPRHDREAVWAAIVRETMRNPPPPQRPGGLRRRLYRNDVPFLIVWLILWIAAWATTAYVMEHVYLSELARIQRELPIPIGGNR